MKTSKLLVVLLLIANMVTGQSAKIELIDLIKNLSPDSTAANKSKSWSSTNNLTIIKWNNILPKIEDNVYVKKGTVIIASKGKTIKCDDMDEGESLCEWDIILQGTKTGYSSFTLEAGNLHFEDNNIDMIDFFFDKNKLKAKLLGKDTESVLFWNYKYLLQIPGKMDIWMKMTYENRTATASQAEFNNYTDLFYIELYTDKKSFDAAAF